MRDGVSWSLIFRKFVTVVLSNGKKYISRLVEFTRVLLTSVANMVIYRVLCVMDRSSSKYKIFINVTVLMKKCFRNYFSNISCDNPGVASDLIFIYVSREISNPALITIQILIRIVWKLVIRASDSLRRNLINIFSL